MYAAAAGSVVIRFSVSIILVSISYLNMHPFGIVLLRDQSHCYAAAGSVVVMWQQRFSGSNRMSDYLLRLSIILVSISYLNMQTAVAAAGSVVVNWQPRFSGSNRVSDYLLRLSIILLSISYLNMQTAPGELDLSIPLILLIELWRII